MAYTCKKPGGLRFFGMAGFSLSVQGNEYLRKKQNVSEKSAGMCKNVPYGQPSL